MLFLILIYESVDFVWQSPENKKSKGASHTEEPHIFRDIFRRGWRVVRWFQTAKYPNIWLIWLFGYLVVHKKHGQVGYLWKEH